MARGRRTEAQIREEMENLTTEVALGKGLKGTIVSLFKETGIDGFQTQLLEGMQDAMENALEPYPTSSETSKLHDEYEDMNNKIDGIESKVEDIYDFLDARYKDVGNNDFLDKIEEIVQSKINWYFQDLGKQFSENLVNDIVSKVNLEITKVNETPEEKIARLEQELAERDV